MHAGSETQHARREHMRERIVAQAHPPLLPSRKRDRALEVRGVAQ